MSRLTLSFKGKVLKVFPLEGDELIIGSDPSCAIHIDSLAVQQHHAKLTREGENYLLKDLNSPEGTFVNNEQIRSRTLKDGDLVRVGKHTLAFQEVASIDDYGDALQSHKAPRDAWLQILSGNNLGKTVSLNRQLTNIGTTGVQTAVIARRNDGYFLSHLEGAQPPKVGDVPIGDRSWHLQDGDIIQIGNVRLQFYYG